MSNKEIVKLVNQISRDLDRLKKLVGEGTTRREDQSSTPGIAGSFDGTYMVDGNSNKYEVPPNYAAKTRLVFGDGLKMIKREDGSNYFKHVQKVPRKKVEGIVTKKEGDWYVLTEHGSHRVSPAAVDFHKVELNDKVIVCLPEKQLTSPFAALDKVLGKEAPKTAKPVKSVSADDTPEKVETIGEVKELEKGIEGELELSRAAEPDETAEDKEPKPKRAASPKRQGKSSAKKPKKSSTRKKKPAKPKGDVSVEDNPEKPKEVPEPSPEPQPEVPAEDMVDEDDDLR